MIVIVITGGIGAGKSLASDYFRSRGAVVIDTDEVAREQLDPGTDTFASVEDEFGSSALDATGRIDPAALAAEAFVSEDRTARLNAIVHPAVSGEVETRLAALRDSQNAPQLAVVEVPLLVEAPAIAGLADIVLAIAADPELRVGRAVSAGKDAEDVRRRLERQATDDERARIADRVIANEGTREEFLGRLAQFWDDVVEPRGSE